MTPNRLLRIFMGVMLCLAAATSASAQSAIAGVVKDTSGAVLPGVTVEASSDALIEGSRTAVTDGAGQYRIIDLRPGAYAVGFTLTGFRQVKREGITLPASFTAIEPTIDLFNILNNNAVTSAVTTIGPSLWRPSAIVMGRLLRVGGDVTF